MWQPSLLLAFRTLDPQSLWWRREWHITSVACLTTADPLLVVLPTTSWNPGLWSTKTVIGRFLILRPHCHFVWWEASSICAGAFPMYHIWPILTMEQLPHVFVPSRTPLVLEFPCGLVLEPVISKTGYSLPVDRFRLSLPGRFNLDCVVAVASVRSCLDLEELFQLALHRTRHCNIFCR